MKSEMFSCKVNVPTLDEFAEAFPHYGPFSRGAGRFLFDLITSPEAHVRLSVVSEELNLPAVAGIGKRCHAEARRHKVLWNGYLKQFIGAVVCSSMEANGFEKTKVKKAVPLPMFTKGEVYRRAS